MCDTELAAHKDRLLRILIDAVRRLAPHARQLIEAVGILEREVEAIEKLATLQVEDVQKALLSASMLDEIETALNGEEEEE